MCRERTRADDEPVPVFDDPSCGLARPLSWRAPFDLEVRGRGSHRASTRVASLDLHHVVRLPGLVVELDPGAVEAQRNEVHYQVASAANPAATPLVCRAEMTSSVLALRALTVSKSKRDR